MQAWVVNPCEVHCGGRCCSGGQCDGPCALTDQVRSSCIGLLASQCGLHVAVVLHVLPGAGAGEAARRAVGAAGPARHPAREDLAATCRAIPHNIRQPAAAVWRWGSRRCCNCGGRGRRGCGGLSCALRRHEARLCCGRGRTRHVPVHHAAEAALPVDAISKATNESLFAPWVPIDLMTGLLAASKVALTCQATRRSQARAVGAVERLPVRALRVARRAR
mmetsp:Transcript_46893/g.135593  ORF Transcript_46893/g.135593 Transcript_46893/m.135593 type:complete len:220 (-) Transcript_46893:807-1466(-)